jgi:hypothetical protein
LQTVEVNAFLHIFDLQLLSLSGIIHDFAGPYHIGVGQMAFGSPTRYLQYDPEKCEKKTWDEGVESGCGEYANHNHNICFDNCHSHVAQCLDDMRYGGSSSYNMFKLGVAMFFFGKFTDGWGVVKTFLPFTIILFMILYFTGSF